jgi:tetratricopeptide (TPR) repeat protein
MKARQTSRRFAEEDVLEGLGDVSRHLSRLISGTIYMHWQPVSKTVLGLVLGVSLAAMVAVFVWIQSPGTDAPFDLPRRSGLSTAQQASTVDADTGEFEEQTVASTRSLRELPSFGGPPEVPHPLLKEAAAAVLADGIDEVPSTAGPELAAIIRTVAKSVLADADLAQLAIDYPQDGTIFPPEIVPPTLLWHEPEEHADTWLVDVAFGDAPEHLYALCPGNPPPADPIDPDCIAENNQLYRPTPYQASAKSWTPADDVWAAIKQRSAGRAVSVAIVGFSSEQPEKVLSCGSIAITTSNDPVGAPIFYRDVPLAPSVTKRGAIKPLGDDAVTLIAWRLRDLSKPESRLLLTDVPKCTNCHSFSADGKVLGMDLDGPGGDKGAYVVAPMTREMVIEEKDVISWNSFPDKPEGHRTIGFLSRISPEGRYAVTTLNEAVFVCNFLDYRFLQVFYPTRGILGFYSRTDDEIKALPGADDPAYVHCDAVWSPDGEQIVFARAQAKDPYADDGELPTRPNDTTETQIQYDLYRIPFNDGRGGKPEPIAGASNNGMSNTFPKVSPDGKWIVFVQCRNGQLLRPDSKLWIVPAAGGTARLMRCNTWRMNSWHSFSPNGRWLVFSSKANTPYTQMFLTHLDEDGNDSPAILIPNSTAANRAVNLPEFVNVSYEGLARIEVPIFESGRLTVRGIELAKQGMLEQAIARFETALRLNTDNVEAQVRLGQALFQQGKLEEAAAHFRAASEVDPKNPIPHFNLGSVLCMRGMHEDGTSHLETALKLKPDYFDAHVNIGISLLEQRMAEKAVAHFRAALKIDLESPVAHFNLGNALYMQGMHEEGISHFEAALMLNPDYSDAHLKMGTALLRQGLSKKAAAHFQKSLVVDPTNIDARLALGSALVAQGNFQSAVAEFENANRLDPDNLRAMNDLAWLLAVCPLDDVRDGARAVELADRACTASGYRDPQLMTTLAAAYAEVGRFSDAIAVATKALDLLGPGQELQSQRLRRGLQRYQKGKPCRSQN